MNICDHCDLCFCKFRFTKRANNEVRCTLPGVGVKSCQVIVRSVDESKTNYGRAIQGAASAAHIKPGQCGLVSDTGSTCGIFLMGVNGGLW